MSRVLMIGLDGLELSLAEAMMAEGLLPHMKALRETSARFLLDHGEAKFTGLAWEHVSSGRSPEDGGRASAIAFDPQTYRVSQPNTDAAPFMASLPVRTVVFDLPYCDFTRAGGVRGISNWGAHDPGVTTGSVPADLMPELEERFGAYPAPDCIYGFTWQSVERTQHLADALESAVRVRADIAKWLLGTRLPDWDLSIVVVSETHSSAEPLWHGIDPEHPLHGVPSAAIARDGLRRIYIAVDALIGTLRDTFPDATTMLFAMHGMGSNDSDVPAMVLLPELLYRHAFGRPHMSERQWAGALPSGVPLLADDETWSAALRQIVPTETRTQKIVRRLARLVGHPAGVKHEMAWMPAARYAHFWPRMPAIAIPSYYDGRVRINLEGRERNGRVPFAQYREACEAIVKLVGECRDPLSGAEVVENVSVPEKPALDLDPFDSDLCIRFKVGTLGLKHPRHGTIGPVPYLRTGGHTGDWGFLYLNGPEMPPQDFGQTSAFNVVPTAVDLLGMSGLTPLSGRSLVSRIHAARPASQRAGETRALPQAGSSAH